MFLGAAVVMLLATAAMVWAYTPDKIYNRVVPLMDYAPQELGVYDALYGNLVETDCRICHGSSLADRHHYSETALTYGCTPCHELCTPDVPNPGDCPNGVVVKNNCSATGCHDTFDNGWHHMTTESATDQCTACHDPALVDAVQGFQSFAMSEPLVVTPTPFSCENCHWEQPVIIDTLTIGPWQNGDPQGDNPFGQGEMAKAGHPSTFDHNDPYSGYQMDGSTPGNWNDYFEYGKPILSNFDTHHMLFDGNVSTDCARCHSQDPDDPSWDPYNAELIRYCETCHGMGSLHTIEAHVGDWVTLPGDPLDPDAVRGWEAVGFHLPDLSNTDTTDQAPTTYKVFTANEQCYGCHANQLPTWMPQAPAVAPSISSISPQIGTDYAEVTIYGDNFGNQKLSTSSVKIKLTSGTTWSEVPVVSWTSNVIEFQMPSWTYSTGNYYVAVEVLKADGNMGNSGLTPSAVFIYDSAGTLDSINSTTGACRENITINGSDFGGVRDWLDAGTKTWGRYTVVQFVAAQGTYIATVYGAWSNTSFKVKFGDVFEDTDGNYFKDGTEPLIRKCESLGLGTYSVYVTTVYYEDTNDNDQFDAGDTIFDVADSDPDYFELVTKPVLYLVNPPALERSHYCGPTLKNGVIKIHGWGFGPSQGLGKVFVGTGPMYTSDTGVELTRTAWTATLIKAALDIPAVAPDKKLFVWVEKDGQKTDASYGWPQIRVLTDSCP